MATYLRVWAEELEKLASAEPVAWAYGEQLNFVRTAPGEHIFKVGNCEMPYFDAPLYAAPTLPSVSRDALKYALQERSWLDATDDVVEVLRELGIKVMP